MKVEVLKGIRVLDLTRLLPGPFGSALLARLGAEVIRVEPPEEDMSRFLPAFFQSINLNKKSLSLDLKHPTGKEVFFRLLRTSQILLEQFRPGVMERLGLSYEECIKHNPKLIYASLNGYGSSGPYAQRAGHDLNYISLAGIASITGTEQGEPVIPGVQIADLVGGLYLVIGVLSALEYVRQNQEGLKLELSMFEGALSLVAPHLAEYFRTGIEPGAGQMDLNGALPNYNFYQTCDGRWISLGCLEVKFWEEFCQAIGKEEWKKRLLQGEEERKKLKQDLAQVFASRTLKEWEEFAQAHPNLCLEPVRKFSEIASDPQVQARNLIRTIKDQQGNQYQMVATPVRFPSLQETDSKPAPGKGQDTIPILKELGYSEREIESLKAEKVI